MEEHKMKKVMEKVIFVTVGSLLTIIGYHFGSFDNNSADAQLNAQPVLTNGEFNKIRCRNLEIVDADGNTRILLAIDLFENGFISIPHEDGRSAVLLAVAGNEDGYITVSKAGDKSAATLHTTDYGGQVSIFSKTGENVLQIGTTENRAGYLRTIDKFGDRTGHLGPQGKYQYGYWKTPKFIVHP